ncbi:MAG: choice-of-anchor I family protein, partial [Planctomycetota bacterium]
YIAVAGNSKFAWVTLQENNAIARVNIDRAEVQQIFGLGFKNHGEFGAGFDASDRDDQIRIRRWPVFGMYQPDAIGFFVTRGRAYLITANEGDARDYAGFSEEARVGELTLDGNAFENAQRLQRDAALGRLTVTTTLGDDGNDGDYEALYAFGARSVSIWSASGRFRQIADTQDQIESLIASIYPDQFNSDNDANDSFDSRSDAKGPEPEGLAIFKRGGQVFAFVGLERIGGVMIVDVTSPSQPRFVDYVNLRDFNGDPMLDTAGDLGPEGLLVIEAADSPTGTPLLVVCNEISGSTTIYRIVSGQ